MTDPKSCNRPIASRQIYDKTSFLKASNILKILHGYFPSLEFLGKSFVRRFQLFFRTSLVKAAFQGVAGSLIRLDKCICDKLLLRNVRISRYRDCVLRRHIWKAYKQSHVTSCSSNENEAPLGDSWWHLRTLAE